MEKEKQFSRRYFLKGAAALFLLEISKRSAFAWPAPEEENPRFVPPLPTPFPTPGSTSVSFAPETLRNERFEFRYPIKWGNRLRPEIALTFDDGWSRPEIEQILVILRENKIKGEFFVVGRQLLAFPDLWRGAINEGHLVLNHSYSHKNFASLTDEEIKNEVLGWEKAAVVVLGEKYAQKMKQESPFLRLPGGGGSQQEKVLKIVAQMGYLPIDWSAETYASVLKKYNLKQEPARPIAMESAAHIIKNAQNGSIILLHFNIWDSLALEEILRGIEEKGLKVKPLTRVLENLH
jgi:peptidoglycan-N-acetylmuramic acid deacetylase